MCRLLVFAGTCTRCGESQTWDDLGQQLACLQAKNAGCFGQCDPGIYAEQHPFDQECDRCTEEDEGIGDISDDTFMTPEKRAAETDVKSHRKKQKV
ncbi:hypothetical protein X797_002367 [Metarhizium robertsii]|uniref:Uncharacterized protein n=1 Tax=Metarhizium robertsii TaxID=568076 RepID=A0A0A1V4A4_9HYPO|nr:hypothetical protein X797_002367 [Metarhizium robertsii]